MIDCHFHRAYKVAYEHSKTNTRCAHMSCSIFINGKLHHVVSNNKENHAEMAALKVLFPSWLTWVTSVTKLSIIMWLYCLFSTKVVDIFVMRVRKDGTLAIAKPCLDCLTVLKRINIRHVYYTNFEGRVVVERAQDMVSSHKCKSPK